MLSTDFLAASLLVGCALAAPTNSTPYGPYMKGFKNATIHSSLGGHGICIAGTVDVTASAENVLLDVDLPNNQIDLTNLVLELSQVNSTLLEVVNGGPNKILVHGGGFDRLYWDNLQGYSYVDYAVEQGYTTFSYDRLGTGLSDHPDAIAIVQAPLHVAILHELIQSLRSGDVGGNNIDHVVGVGHSYGSAQLHGINTVFPDDLDAAILTGASADLHGFLLNLVAQVQTIAALNEPLRFANLSYGYLLPGSIEGLQYGFFRAPSFDPRLLNLAESIKQPQSLGEQVGFPELEPAANFTGPVFILNGQNDIPACCGNCLVPVNQAAAAIKLLYPAASNASDWYLVPKTGHGVNFHYGAGDAYARIVKFLKKNGF